MTNESKNDQNNIVPDVPLERRSKKRKEKESQRRVLNDRRRESINVTNDRRKGPRRRLLVAAAAPLLLQSPKLFEAVLRMGSDLSGFIPSNQLLKAKPQPFPVPPLL